MYSVTLAELFCLAPLTLQFPGCGLPFLPPVKPGVAQAAGCVRSCGLAKISLPTGSVAAPDLQLLRIGEPYGASGLES